MLNSDRLYRILSNTIGYFCVLVFFSLTTYIVWIFYSEIVPTVLGKREYAKFIFHFLLGNWLAVNIYFNYIMAWLTSPGLSRNYQNLAVQYPICKKCFLKKPPRTHHCSWCDQCVLRYDHHCPWLNNCVGFYNHRYFYQFCCFMTAGCFYAGIFGHREYQISLFEEQIYRHIDSFLAPSDIFNSMGVKGFITYYIFIMAYVMSFLLFALSYWHGRMIGRGETSVERLLNQNYIQRYHQQDLIFLKTHDLDRINNWKRFLGVRNLRKFARHILLPSTHKPEGNGVLIDDFEVSTNSLVVKQDYHTYSSDNYLADKYQTKSFSWQRQWLANSFCSCHKVRTLLTNWKDNISYNEI